MIEPPLLAIEVIHEPNQDAFVYSMVSKPLSDVGPVLLLDMGVIVLVIGPASGKLHGLISLVKVLHQMPIQEFRAVIAVKPKQRERQSVFDLLDLREDLCFAFAPDRSLFCPAGGNIDGVDGVDEMAEESLPAMGDGIGLQESWFVSSHWLVLMGICFLRRVPGFVVVLPRPRYFTRAGFKSLSRVAGEIRRRD